MSLRYHTNVAQTGVEWIGPIPRGWTLQPLKCLFRIVGGSTPKSDVEAYWDGDVVWITPTDLGRDEIAKLSASQRTITQEGLESCATTVVPPNSIILSTRAPIGSLGIAKVPLCTNQGCKALVPGTAVHSVFFAYLLSVAKEALQLRGKGTTFLELSADELGAFKVSVPPPPEQTAIASFLDRETGKIDALVQEQKLLIELLNVKRQAVISHAVTKGLNSDAPMKDSGVDWLGEVPEHWDVLMLKRCFSSVDYGISDSLEPDGVVAVLRMGNIQNGRVEVDDLKYVDQVDEDLLLRTDDLLYNRTNSLDLIGKVGRFVEGDGPTTFASYLVRLRTSDNCDPAFMAYLLNTDEVLGNARSRAFVAIGQCNLNPTRYGEIVVAVPPPSEQRSIADVLDARISEIASLAAEAHKTVGLLRERRSALISAAVTGKIDVRNFVSVEKAVAKELANADL
jgi:type I restriction enzyme S subunit